MRWALAVVACSCGGTRAPAPAPAGPDLACAAVVDDASCNIPAGDGYGVLFGNLVSSTGAPIQDATVAATQVPGDIDTHAVAWTTSAGDYAITLVPAGGYSVAVYYNNTHLDLRCIAVEANRVTRLDVKLPAVEHARQVRRCAPMTAPADRTREIAALRAQAPSIQKRLVEMSAESEGGPASCIAAVAEKANSDAVAAARAFWDVVHAVRELEQLERAADRCRKQPPRLE